MMEELEKLIEEMSHWSNLDAMTDQADGPPLGEVFRKALAALKAFRDWHQGEGGDISVRDAVCLAIQEAQ